MPKARLSSAGSPKERRAVSFFRERTGPQLAGFYECEFWSRIILQAAHADDGLRHALVALAAVHEDYEGGSTVGGNNASFALQQYNLAIGKNLEILTSGDGPTLDKYMAPCIVFVCIEMLQRRYGSALSLVKQAVKMFYDATPQQQAASIWPIDIFESILSRLQTQAIGLAGPPAMGTTTPPRITDAVLCGIPDKFFSVAEAKEHFEFYTNTHILSKYTSSSDSDECALPMEVLTEEDRTMWVKIYERWAAAFDTLLDSSYNTMTQRERNAADVMQMRRLMLYTSVDMTCREAKISDFGEDQTFWDLYNPTFLQIVTIAESVINSMRAIGSDGKGRALFTLEMGIVGPLYDTARSCRDPVIRRKAINLLYLNPCQEGLWDSVLAARVAERVMYLEERGLKDIATSAEIGDEDRLSTVVPTFDKERRRAVISYSRPVDSPVPLENKRMEEVIEW